MSNEHRVISRGVFDADFHYRTSIDTDIRKTFDRIRRAQAVAAREGAKPLRENVDTLQARDEVT